MRKVIAGVLMGAAVLSLAACGKTETAATTAAQAAESQDTQADSTEAAADTTGDKKEIVYGTQSFLRRRSFRSSRKRDIP